MSIVQLDRAHGNLPVYQIFKDSIHQKEIQRQANDYTYTYELSNQDKIITKDFLDSTGTYTQLRAIQVAPYDEYEAYDETRDNRLLLYAQGEPHVNLEIQQVCNFGDTLPTWNIYFGNDIVYTGVDLPTELTLNNKTYQLCKKFSYTTEETPVEYSGIVGIELSYVDNDNNKITKLLEYTTNPLNNDEKFTEYIVSDINTINLQGLRLRTKINNTTNYFNITDLNKTNGTFSILNTRDLIENIDYTYDSNNNIIEFRVAPADNSIITVVYNNGSSIVTDTFTGDGSTTIFLINNYNSNLSISLMAPLEINYRIIRAKLYNNNKEEIKINKTQTIYYNRFFIKDKTTKSYSYIDQNYRITENYTNTTLNTSEDTHSFFGPMVPVITYENESSYVIGPTSFSGPGISVSMDLNPINWYGYLNNDNFTATWGASVLDITNDSEDYSNITSAFIIVNTNLTFNTMKELTRIKGQGDDDLKYIGNIIVNKDFKINSVQYVIDTLGKQNIVSLKEYLGDNYNNTFYFEYDGFDGSEDRRTVIFGNENLYNTIKKDVQKFTTNQIEYLSSTEANYNTTYINDEAHNNQIIVLDGETYYCYVTNDSVPQYYMYDITNIEDIKTLINGEEINLPSRNFKVTIDNKQITFEPVNYNLCMVDVSTYKSNVANNEQEDVWSLLYVPYVTNDQIEIFICAILKYTNTQVEPTARPSFSIGINSASNNYNNAFALYHVEEESDYFFAAKSGKSNLPQSVNYQGLDTAEIYLNNGNNLFGSENEEALSNELNAQTWPIENKLYNDILKIENCYFSLNGTDWYNIPYQVEYNEFKDNVLDSTKQNPQIITKNWIDFNELNKREIIKDLPTTDFYQFKINDLGANSFNNNGNILLKARNVLSIPIINNSLDIKQVLINEELNNIEGKLITELNLGDVVYISEDCIAQPYIYLGLNNSGNAELLRVNIITELGTKSSGYAGSVTDNYCNSTYINLFNKNITNVLSPTEISSGVERVSYTPAFTLDMFTPDNLTIALATYKQIDIETDKIPNLKKKRIAQQAVNDEGIASTWQSQLGENGYYYYVTTNGDRVAGIVLPGRPVKDFNTGIRPVLSFSPQTYLSLDSNGNYRINGDIEVNEQIKLYYNNGIYTAPAVYPKLQNNDYTIDLFNKTNKKKISATLYPNKQSCMYIRVYKEGKNE